MNRTLHAVITGDIVSSTQSERDYKEALMTIMKDIQRRDHTFRLEISRGDSFQALIDDPVQGLYILLVIRAGLRRFTIKSNSSNLEDALDARLSLGIGEVTHASPLLPLGEMKGNAFVRSGRALDAMKKEGSLIKITTGDMQLDEFFAVACPLMDAIITKWSMNQSQAIYLYLLISTTQTEIGKLLNVSQRAVGKRLEAGNINEIMQFEEYFKKKLAWTFNL